MHGTTRINLPTITFFTCLCLFQTIHLHFLMSHAAPSQACIEISCIWLSISCTPHSAVPRPERFFQQPYIASIRDISPGEQSSTKQEMQKIQNALVKSHHLSFDSPKDAVISNTDCTRKRWRLLFLKSVPLDYYCMSTKKLLSANIAKSSDTMVHVYVTAQCRNRHQHVLMMTVPWQIII